MKQLWVIGLLVLATEVMAEADGPDYYRVNGVANDDVLNVHVAADPHSKKVGSIPPGASCVKNLGCQGGLSMQEFTELSKSEQAAAKKDHPRWCHIEYQEVKGWVAGRYLVEGDCQKKKDDYLKTVSEDITVEGYAIDVGSKRAGGDYDKDFATDVAECAAWCNRESRCKGFDYYRDIQACWVKEKINYMQPDPNVVTGVKR